MQQAHALPSKWRRTRSKQRFNHSDETPTQHTLERLIARGSYESAYESLTYFHDVRVFASSLRDYEVHFDESLPVEQAAVSVDVII